MRPLRKPTRVALLLWLAGLLLSAVVGWQIHERNQALYAARLAALTQDIEARVLQRFGLYEYGLRGTRGAVVAAGGDAVNRQTFESYIATRDIKREFPGARGLGFIRRVELADEASFSARARADGRPEFAIRQLSPHQGERYVIEYIYPAEGNKGATGLDVASEAKRREAALAAARDGQVRLTAPITLVQAGDRPRHGFLIYLPIFWVGSPLHTPRAREAATLGWAYAPLLVDEVLAGLGPQLEEVSIRLGDAAEPEVFYASTSPVDSAEPTPAMPALQRELQVFGRRWVLQASARPALLPAARPDAALALTMGMALLATLAAGLFWVLLLRREQRQLELVLSVGVIGWRQFLRSPLARWALLALLVFVVSFALLSYQRLWAQQREESRLLLANVVDDWAKSIRVAQDARRKTLAFLADTPPVQGMVRSLPTGFDGQDASPRQAWERRMQQIFSAHLRASPEVYQARLIGIADRGRELVRVERRGQEVFVVPAGELQAKADRPYMAQTLALASGEVWVSELELNQEQGKLEWPHRPTLRFSTPVIAADGRPFGILIVNVDVSDRVAEFAATAPVGVTLHLLNDGGDFLFHPDPAKRFGFDLGKRQRWQQEFQPAALSEGPGSDRLRAWQGPQGRVIAAEAMVQANVGSPVGLLRLVASQPEARLQAELWPALGRSLLLPVLGGISACLLLFYYWAAVQRQLQSHAQRLRLGAIVGQSADAIVGLDAALRVIAWNHGAEQMFGLVEAQAMGQRLDRLLQTDADLAKLLRAGVADHEGGAREFGCRTRDGRHLTLAMSVSRLREDEEGESAAILRDVTLERATQQRILELNQGLEQQVLERTASLAQERERLAQIIRGTDVGTWEWQVQTGAIRVDERWAEMLGYRLHELQPLSKERWHSLIHAEDLPVSAELLQRHLDGSLEQYSAELRMRHREGYWVWVLARGRLSSRAADGSPSWMHGTHLDITAVKEAELEVKRVAALLRSVLQAATEFAIVATDRQGLITIFNRGAELMLGYRAEDLVGHSSPERLHLPAELTARGAELSAEYGLPVQGFQVFVHKAEREGAEQREWTYVRKDGSQLQVSLMVTAIRNEAGGLIGYLGIAQDITERHRTELALRQAKAAAERASSAKSLFLANMSHEIRTPMNAVIGVAHLLGSSRLDEDQRHLLGQLQIAGRSLLGIINDVLDLSKIEAGALSFELAAMSPSALLQELALLFGPQAQAKGIHFELIGADRLPALLMADELRLRQVLVNLISNALKFTEQGSVTLELQTQTDAQGNAWLQWQVRDTGIGITGDALNSLFDPFVQADVSTTRRFGGTGLGLAIVRKLAQLMGGEVSARSEVGRGSEFTVRLPLILPTAPQAQAAIHALPKQAARIEAAPSAGLYGLRLLLVDDSEINLDIGRRLLEREAAEVHFASSAAQALALLREAPDRFDAVLMDVQMPGMDGFAATRRIRGELGLQRLPVLALTAGALGEQKRLAKAAGMTDFLTKPLDPPVLVRALRTAIEAVRGVPLPLAPAASTADWDPNWPQIEGIDAKAAALRVANDAGLFLSLLERLLREFGDTRLALPADESWPPGQAEQLAERVHKLRGTAGLLGANEVHRIAAETEAALRAGLAPAQVQAPLRELQAALLALAAAAQPALASRPSSSHEQALQPGDSSIAADEWRRLRSLLARQDLEASEWVHRHRGALRARLGAECAERFVRALDELDYEGALRLIDDVQDAAA